MADVPVNRPDLFAKQGLCVGHFIAEPVENPDAIGSGGGASPEVSKADEEEKIARLSESQLADMVAEIGPLDCRRQLDTAAEDGERGFDLPSVAM